MQTFATKTIREIALEVPATTRVFEEFKIDYCCGGRKLLADVCRNRPSRTPVRFGTDRLYHCDTSRFHGRGDRTPEAVDGKSMPPAWRASSGIVQAPGDLS